MCLSSGTSSENFHELLGRIHGFAVIDIVGTALGGIILANITGENMILTSGSLFVLGHAVHLGFNIKTKLT